MQLVLGIIGILCCFYFISIALFVGHGTNFYFIWLFLGLAAFLILFLMKKGIWTEHLPLFFRRLFWILTGSGLLLFAIVEGFVLSGFHAKGELGLDYLVVLGAQMKESGPSKALQYRLDTAYEYLVENPDTKVIVSGGQGADEPVSEAQGMYDYLVEKGISPERILKENRSRNTFQNLTFSAELLQKEKDSVGIVSNNFHIFRAVKIAKKAGYERVCGIAARGEAYLQLNNMMREFFGVMKDFVFGNL